MQAFVVLHFDHQCSIPRKDLEFVSGGCMYEKPFQKKKEGNKRERKEERGERRENDFGRGKKKVKKKEKSVGYFSFLNLAQPF